MKTIILALVLTFTMNVFSQKIDTNYRKLSVGDELIRFEKQYSTGVCMSIVGITTAYIGGYNKNDGVILFGSVIGLIGTFISINSHTHIKNAGILLNERGIGLAIPLSK
jgi:hypothetical protein